MTTHDADNAAADRTWRRIVGIQVVVVALVVALVIFVLAVGIFGIGDYAQRPIG